MPKALDLGDLDELLIVLLVTLKCLFVYCPLSFSIYKLLKLTDSTLARICRKTLMLSVADVALLMAAFQLLQLRVQRCAKSAKQESTS